MEIQSGLFHKMDENPGIIYTEEESEQEEEVVNIQPQIDAIPPENLIELLQFDRDAEKFVCISELREKYLTGLCQATFYSKLRRLGVSPVTILETKSDIRDNRFFMPILKTKIAFPLGHTLCKVRPIKLLSFQVPQNRQ